LLSAVLLLLLCYTPTPATYTLSLHDALPICNAHDKPVTLCGEMAGRPRCFLPLIGMGLRRFSMSPAFVPSIKELVRRTQLERARSEEHTSELQSQSNLVCRLLLEKKKKVEII